MPIDTISYLLRLIILIGFISSCKSSSKVIQTDRGVTITQFGAIPNDGKLDDSAFKKAFEYLRANNGERLLIPEGRYIVSKRVELLNWKEDLQIKGVGEVNIELRESDFLFINQAFKEGHIRSNLLKGQSSIKIKDSRNVLSDQILHISSSSAYETGWGYKENDLHRVSEVEGNLLKLSDKSLFNYHQGKEEVSIKTYQKNTLTIEGINFTLNVDRDRLRHTIITIQRLAIDLKDVSFKVRGGEGYFHRGVAVSGAFGCRMQDVVLENLEYGLLLNFCRKVEARNITALSCRHAIAPSTATVDIQLENISGKRCQGVLDAHAAFNVRADGISDLEAIQFSNFRAIGVEISNSIFELGNNYTQDYAYWSTQTLVPEYHQYYEEHDVIFRNVQWIHKRPGNFNGLTAYSCRNFVVESCTTHNVSLYGTLHGKVEIINSHLGNLRINSHNTTVNNSTMDGSLFPKTKYVFHMTGKGATVLEGVQVVNYNDDTYLFDKFYNTDHYNSVSLKGCNVEALKGWTPEVYYPNLKYNKLYIADSKFEGISQIKHPIFFETKSAITNIQLQN